MSYILNVPKPVKNSVTQKGETKYFVCITMIQVHRLNQCPKKLSALTILPKKIIIYALWGLETLLNAFKKTFSAVTTQECHEFNGIYSIERAHILSNYNGRLAEETKTFDFRFNRVCSMEWENWKVWISRLCHTTTFGYMLIKRFILCRCSDEADMSNWFRTDVGKPWSISAICIGIFYYSRWKIAKKYLKRFFRFSFPFDEFSHHRNCRNSSGFSNFKNFQSKKIFFFECFPFTIHELILMYLMRGFSLHPIELSGIFSTYWIERIE